MFSNDGATEKSIKRFGAVVEASSHWWSWQRMPQKSPKAPNAAMSMNDCNAQEADFADFCKALQVSAQTGLSLMGRHAAVRPVEAAFRRARKKR